MDVRIEPILHEAVCQLNATTVFQDALQLRPNINRGIDGECLCRLAILAETDQVRLKDTLESSLCYGA